MSIVIILVLFATIRARLLNFPLERDEGEYAYGGSLILKGIVPYQLCYTMKWPGTAVIYAVIEALFGQSGTAIHMGFLVVNSATIVLLFVLGARLFGALGGVISSATYGLLSVAPSVLGFSAHATHFIVAMAVAGLLILLRARDSGRLVLFFYSGILLGLSSLMKQPGTFFLLFAVCWTAWPALVNDPDGLEPRTIRWRTVALQVLVLICGGILPFAITGIVLLRAGALGKFWFWTFTYAHAYGQTIRLRQGIHNIWEMSLAVAGGTFPIWLLGLISPIPLLLDNRLRRTTVFLGAFATFSFTAVCLGLHARNHYFVLLLPMVSLLCAGGVSAATNLLARPGLNRKWAMLPLATFLCCFCYSLVRKSEFFFPADPVKLCRTVHGSNPFPEAAQIADFIKKHSAPSDRVAVIGSEPEIYFESGRLSATGYVYTYALMEPQPFASMMQKQMISEVEATQPRFLVYVDCWSSWLTGPRSDKRIFGWISSYVQNGYRLVGVIDELKEGTEYHWADAMTYSPRSEHRILVYERSGPRT